MTVMNSKNYDIIIIGGGLVGASLALALANKAFTIAIVEATEPREINVDDLNARSIVLSESSKRIFETLGIWQKLSDYITPINTIHISDRGHFGVTRISADAYDLPAVGYVIPIPALAQVLYQQLAQATNLTWIRPATVTAIDTHTIVVNQEEISGNLIVVADGANSSTRDLLQIAVETTNYNQSAIVANIDCDRPHKSIAYERFTEEGPIALLPMGETRATVIWTMTHEHASLVELLDEQQFLDQLQQAFGFRAGKFIRANKRSCYPLNLSVSQKQQAKGVLILGNAAHTLHPVSAQGFNLGLRDVAQLAEEILAAKKIDDPALIAKYLTVRALDQKATIQYADDLVRIFSNNFFPITPLRGFALSKLNNISFLKNIIAQRAMGFRGKASKLLRGIKL